MRVDYENPPAENAPEGKLTVRVDYENPPAENAPEGKLTGWALMRHDGFHNHPWPVPKKLDTVSMHALAAVVLKNPKAGALQLKMGTPNTDPNGAIPQQPFESVVDIHPALLNTDRVRHYRREILRNSNMLPGKQGGGMGDKFIHDMFDWEELSHLVIPFCTTSANIVHLQERTEHSISIFKEGSGALHFPDRLDGPASSGPMRGGQQAVQWRPVI
ncbi:hypothetical protein MJO29_007836 [Puccinia striiformis f. sp. tritici]|nr:hypothetical protein MJO29_007836 [Puccinia striiformis f. sp. tritici]